MKTSIVLFFLAIQSFAFSQEGKIYPKGTEIKIDAEKIYVYEPPQGIIITEDLKITFVHQGYKKRSVPLDKNENGYGFRIKVPDSIDVLVLAITNKKGEIIDNNGKEGYVVYLKNKTKEETQKAKLNYLQLYRFANYFLKLEINPITIIPQYDALFGQNPHLKQDNVYRDYLMVKYQTDKEKTKPEIIEFAQILSKKNDENSLTLAHGLYSFIKMGNEADALETLILKKYPKGNIAKGKFMSDFYEQKDKTEDFILNAIETYTIRFKDESKQAQTQFYFPLINLYLKNKDTANLLKYEDLVEDKLFLVNIYNNHAWNLSGESLTNPGTDLDFAAELSKKTVDMVNDIMDNPSEDEDLYQLQKTYDMCADTYALISYKQGKYDLAFQYQDAIAKIDGLDTGGKERYAGIAEKAKGLEFTRKFLEEQLIAGENSQVMINHLHEVYKKLNLPVDKFEKIKQNSLKLATHKAKKELIDIFGDTKSIDFTLTNIKGEKVKLSDYKGKVVVLDFWATWCGPCRASFPSMQNLVNTYKGDNVEFFFINTWERKEPTEIRKNVSKFLADNKYTFNVLFDYKDDVVAKYKITGIPAKVVIDKEGNIISLNSSDDNLRALIEENIN